MLLINSPLPTIDVGNQAANPDITRLTWIPFGALSHTEDRYHIQSPLSHRYLDMFDIILDKSLAHEYQIPIVHG